MIEFVFGDHEAAPLFACSPDKGASLRSELQQPVIESDTMTCVAAFYDV